MILKSRELEVIENNPFQNDVLGRKESGEALKEFVLSANDSVVVCIDAPWGQGKTTFLRMWEQDLKNNDIPTIYFNAWESDFSDDALVCLIGEISASIKELSKTGDESKAREFLETTKNLGASLLKKTIPVAAKIATAGALDLDKVTENALASFSESIAREQIAKYESSKKSIKSFRKAISGFAGSITDIENPKPLVFIIDELDRCRPNFAIEVLEKAKHFFNVDNIVFVLGADKKQLGSSIKAIYGEGLNVNGYLRRFMDFDYVLTPPSKGLFVKALFNKFSFDDYFTQKNARDTQYEGGQSLSIFSELFEIYSLTLREQEHCCTLLSLSIKTTPMNNPLHPLFLCFLIVLKVKVPSLYICLVTGEISPHKLLEKFSSMPGVNELLSNNYGMALETYIVTCKSNRGYGEIYDQYKKTAGLESSNSEVKRRANRILEILNDLDFNNGIGSLDYLLKKIEIASRFKT